MELFGRCAAAGQGTVMTKQGGDEGQRPPADRPHLDGLAVADEEAGAAEVAGGRRAAAAGGLADAGLGRVAVLATPAALLAAQLLLAAEVARDACGVTIPFGVRTGRRRNATHIWLALDERNVRGGRSPGGAASAYARARLAALEPMLPPRHTCKKRQTQLGKQQDLPPPPIHIDGRRYLPPNLSIRPWPHGSIASHHSPTTLS